MISQQKEKKHRFGKDFLVFEISYRQKKQEPAVHIMPFMP